LPGEVSDGFGQGDRCRSEPDPHGGVVGGDVAGGESADPDDGLRVEQDEETGEAVPGSEGVVVQETTGGIPSGVVVQRPGGAVPSGGGKGQCGEALVGGPAHEVAGLVPVRGLGARQPSIEVGLARGGQGQVLDTTP
jgi:hypothetical protein